MSHDPHHSDGAVPSSISVADPTCVWHDSAAEIHMVVVGPVANNVYVLRCRQTGDAVNAGEGRESPPGPVPLTPIGGPKLNGTSSPY